MSTMYDVALWLLAFLVVAHMPVIPVLRLLMLPIPDKADAIACMLGAWIRGTLAIPVDLLSPVVVPVALQFTDWEADKLPRLFHWWDNDVSINGDARQPGQWALEFVPIADTDAARAMCYWAPGHHPRSFWARFVWLGLRNRAIRFSQLLGTSEDGPSDQWSGKTWVVNRVGSAWRYYELVPLGPLALRMHYGYKVPRIPGWDRAPVVAIGFSFKRNSQRTAP